MDRYKLSIGRDVDVDGEDYILNTPKGWRVDYDYEQHTLGFASMAELRQFVRAGGVVPCECKACTKGGAVK